MTVARRSYQAFDKELELKALGTVTSTTAEAGVSFNAGEIEDYKAIIYVTDMVKPNLDETYDFQIMVSATDVDANYREIGKLRFGDDPGSDQMDVQTGKFEIPLSGYLAEQIVADSLFIRVRALISGTAPSVTYGSYITRS